MALNIMRANGTGTPAPVTAAGGDLTFGTNQPAITFAESVGTFLLSGFVVVDLSGAVLTAARTVIVLIRRTNHTPLTVPGSVIVVKLPVNEASGDNGDVVIPIPHVSYTLSGSVGDHLHIRAHLDSVTGVAGAVTIREASLVAEG